ncbi:MAG: carbon-nitrogen hydrolase family protein [Desulfarculaceae bacterium]|nr:carbon-nitrogen hydrolase family protein [Desulfarculaceae bacterium]MCF8071521.1 carbon-nitrogen hydrolase family protein [Desulfarculaceae bacterium]MCF8102336.1 carbon-nitrogen hydrolase family protein [Desulfarculaceae bacterium]MCF8114800.1 carbon-nitrogen hydrolase family protein [Desulfarculaceae bacterium]
MVKAATVQMDVALARTEDNKARILEMAGQTQADLVVFPELANSGGAFNSLQEALPHADTIPGPFVDQLIALAKEQRRNLALGLLEKKDGVLLNSAVFITSQGEMHLYRKSHLPFLGLDRFVTPGDRLGLFDTPLGKVGLCICYEWRFPELARCLALEGADLLVGMSNWPTGAKVIPSLLMPARAAENRVWIVSSNRVGVEEGYEFVGGSAIIDPEGNTVASVPDAQEGVALAEMDLSLSRNKRLVKVPGEYEIDLWEDRCPSLYGATARKAQHD